MNKGLPFGRPFFICGVGQVNIPAFGLSLRRFIAQPIETALLQND
jgi:hypothetical protein